MALWIGLIACVAVWIVVAAIARREYVVHRRRARDTAAAEAVARERADWGFDEIY